MGAAKEHRDTAAAARMFGDELKEIRNTEMAKARFWSDLMKAGHVLTFRAASGRILAAGPYQTAVGCPSYALLWSEPGARFPERDYHGGAWDIALRIIQFCGRVKPRLIDGEKQ